MNNRARIAWTSFEVVHDIGFTAAELLADRVCNEMGIDPQEEWVPPTERNESGR